MSTSVIPTDLDEAFERMAASSAFELPNGFVNHGPMGCEALAALGLDDWVDSWARRFERVPGPAVTPKPTAHFDWEGALGDYRMLPEWIGHLQSAIDENGWRQTVATWVPRLSPALSTKLFHGVIHVAHAARALTVADTPVRRAELARALGYWAARFSPGQTPSTDDRGLADDLRSEATAAAEHAARHYLSSPSIFHLHGVTGAMAVELLIDHTSSAGGHVALSQLRAEHAHLYRGSALEEKPRTGEAPMDEVAQTAAESGDVHQVKLVEACRRGLVLTGSPAFSAAAETVTRTR